MKIAYIYRQLNERDFKVLLTIEKYMPRYEYVAIEIIDKETRLPPNLLNYSLLKLNKLKLIKRRTGSYVGYCLTYLGYDCLALRTLVERGVLAALGDKMGVGKESDVYEGLTPANEKVIVKFHRVGRTSFKHIRRVRTYAAEKSEYPWLLQAKIAAEREYKVLDELYKVKARVPKPLGRSRHVVVTEFIEGIELYRYKEAINPLEILRKILETIRKAYLDVGVVHGDLSEYNIMIQVSNGNEEPYIIDWPQFVEKDHPSAPQLLERDVNYVIKFFKKQYRIDISREPALKYVKGEVDEI